MSRRSGVLEVELGGSGAFSPQQWAGQEVGKKEGKRVQERLRWVRNGLQLSTSTAHYKSLQLTHAYWAQNLALPPAPHQLALDPSS